MRGDEATGVGGREARGDAIDPITAWALAVKALAEMFTEGMRGQPLDLREKQWRRWEQVMDRLDRLFDSPEKKPH